MQSLAMERNGRTAQKSETTFVIKTSILRNVGLMEETANPMSVSAPQITTIVSYQTTFAVPGTKTVIVMQVLITQSVALTEEIVGLQVATQNFVMPL